MSKTNLSVAINSASLSGGHAVRGIGFYTKSLISSLETIGVSVTPLDFQLVEKSKLLQYDILHYPHFDLFFPTLETYGHPKVVVTIHDVIPLLYPKHYPPGVKGRISFMKQRKALQSVAAIITDSETSKKDIVRFLKVRPDKVFSIHLAPGQSTQQKVTSDERIRVRKRFKLPKRFVLYVGDVNYNKNISTLATACKIADIQLVIVGKQAAEVDSIAVMQSVKGPRDWMRYVMGSEHPEQKHYAKLRKLFKKKYIHRLGYVETSDLRALYQLATVYCQPSLYEGFGLPVLEAMSAGTPVVASRTQALVEVGGDACLYADPLNPQDFAAKILEIANDETVAKRLTNAGKKHAQTFSWEEAGRRTLEVYKTLK